MLHTVVILMGVSGCGKTAIGRLLSDKTGLPFFDADDFHPPANKKKMSSGIPLTDADRSPWLQTLARHIEKWSSQQGAILACSALKKSYRDVLRSGNKSATHLRFIYLKGTAELIFSRIKERNHEFMPSELLTSQFETLEEPKQALVVDISQPPETIADQIISELSL